MAQTRVPTDLYFLDEHKNAVLNIVKQIGTDGGLLDKPVDVPQDGLVLAPAERADLIVDFRAFKGQRLTLVNTAGAPFGGEPAAQPVGVPDLDNRLPYPEIMEFRVSAQEIDDPFVLPEKLSSFERLTHDKLPHDHMHRVVALVESNENNDDMLMFRELAPVNDQAGDKTLIAVKDASGNTTRYRTVAMRFEDTVNWFVAYGSTEVWKILNLTGDTHPFHVHLVQFQVLGRDLYDVDGFNQDSNNPIVFKDHGQLDANECGWKDVVRVNPGEMVSIAATFDGHTGRYMYHCHVLEHEDHDMMRPFVVLPEAVIKAMGMGDMAMPMPTPGTTEHDH